MATETASSIIRAALTADININTDQLIEKVKAAGIKATPQSVKNLTYNLRSGLKKKKPGNTAQPAKAAARQTAKPAPRPAVTAVPVAPSASSAPDVSSVLANVAMVNAVARECGGIEKVRQAMETVKVCGGLDEFLKHLELVADIRAGQSK